MEHLSSISQVIPFLTVLVIAGLVAGLLAGVFGIGGGAVLVPVFYQMFGELGVDESVRMHLSVGTSLAIVVPTSLRSFTSHLKRGDVDRDLLRAWVVAVPVGVIFASLITAFISGAGLRIIFAIIVVVVGFKLLFAKDSWRLGDELPGNPAISLIGGVIGFFSTFMGIGGGVINNTFMTLFGRPLHQAVSTSSGVGVLISLPGVIGYVLAGMWAESQAGTQGMGVPALTIGFVNFATVFLIIPITLIVTPFGVKAAHALSRRQLEIMFGIFMFLVAGRFFYSLAG